MNMRIVNEIFNTYLVAALLGAVLCSTGCKSVKGSKANPPLIHFYLESSIPDPNRTLMVRISEEPPVDLPIDRSRLMDQSNIRNIGIIDKNGTFSLLIAFDHRGTWILEQISTAHRGKRCAIYCEFPYGKTNVTRWIGAPLITHRITDGVLEFTPRMTRQECEALIKALQPMIKQKQKEE